MNEPLNPDLYARLQHYFGDVRVTNPGQRRVVQHRPEYTRPGKLIATVRDGHKGEQYRINCPFCGDTRGRCYISHAYGTFDFQTGQQHNGLWYCHNERCHKTFANHNKLAGKIGREFPRQTRRRAAAPQIATSAVPLPQPQPALFPRSLVPVNQLPADHPAATYLVDRGFDLAYLSTVWDVRYCDDGHNCRPDPTNRIWFPIRQPRLLMQTDGAHVETVGWQARAIPGVANRVQAKYLFPAGIAKSRFLYGLDMAIHADGPVVVVEGPTDVWRYGPGAVALFGKCMAAAQRDLMKGHFARQAIVVLLDADAQPEAREIQRQLTEGLGIGDRMVAVGQLPMGRDDPADGTREELAVAVTSALKGAWR